MDLCLDINIGNEFQPGSTVVAVENYRNEYWIDQFQKNDKFNYFWRFLELLLSEQCVPGFISSTTHEFSLLNLSSKQLTSW